MKSAYWLTDVRLETGYVHEEGEIVGTETEVYHLRIEDAVIKEIVSASTQQPLSTDLPKHAGNNFLLLPSFVEKHVHLDKTLLGEPWRAVLPADGVVARCEIEKLVIPSLPSSMQQRADNLLHILLQSGSTHVRTHVDIYPEAGTQHFEMIKQTLGRYEERLSYEIVAFPQHGLLRTQSKELLREALRNGANLIGGVDPGSVDGDIEASLQMMVELAVEAGAGIDLHLHDADYLGTFTMKRLASLTIEAGLQGKVAISHAFGLGEVSEQEASATAAMLAAAGITIVTSVPHSRTLPPVPLLSAMGVEVAVGCDNIFDTWQPFGNGDLLERAGRLAERFRMIDEYSLSRTLKYITGGITPLDDEGKKIWPKVGDVASMVLVDASCSAEAIARRSARKAVYYRGKLVHSDMEHN